MSFYFYSKKLKKNYSILFIPKIFTTNIIVNSDIFFEFKYNDSELSLSNKKGLKRISIDLPVNLKAKWFFLQITSIKVFFQKTSYIKSDLH